MTPITVADLLVPFFDEHEIKLSGMLTNRGTGFCGGQRHEYELDLAVECLLGDAMRQDKEPTNQ